MIRKKKHHQYHLLYKYYILIILTCIASFSMVILSSNCLCACVCISCLLRLSAFTSNCCFSSCISASFRFVRDFFSSSKSVSILVIFILDFSNCLCCKNKDFIRAALLENWIFAYAKTKAQTSFTVIAKLISAFVFATWIVLSLSFLNPKFQISSPLLCLYSSVCVRPGRKPRRPVFSRRGSYVKIIVQLFVLVVRHLSFANKFEKFEPSREKTNNVVSEKVLHKPCCTVTQGGCRLALFDLRRRGSLLSMN